MLEIVLTISQRLCDDGISRGDRIAVCSENRIELWLLTLACWKSNVVIVPASTRYPVQKLQDALDSVCCDVLFTSGDCDKEILGCRHMLLEDYISCGDYETSPVTFEQLGYGLDAEASILFTSGSSGRPKGVLHTIGNHYYNAQGALQNSPFERGDRWLVSLPMYHISGFSLIMRSLVGEGTLVFPRTGESIANALINRNITHVSLVPAQLKKLMRNARAVNALRKCKSILLGGAGSNPALFREALERGLPLSTTYGLTEMASQVTTASPLMLKQNPQASGGVLPYREVRIGDDGEILLKGPTLFKGYVDKDRVELPLDSEGYFHTGDVGKLDGQGELGQVCSGKLTVIGRKDRMFISGGENIYPEEVENALLTMESVEKACVVPVPDETMGYRPAAFVKLAAPTAIPNAKTLEVHLRACLEGFKVPIAFFSWPDSDNLKPDLQLFQQMAFEKISGNNPS